MVTSHWLIIGAILVLLAHDLTEYLGIVMDPILSCFLQKRQMRFAYPIILSMGNWGNMMNKMAGKLTVRALLPV